MNLNDLDLIVFDCEVFAHDYLIVFKESDGSHRAFWNDPAEIEQYIHDHKTSVFVGFNSKHYDQYIVKGILSYCVPEEVKEINDFIIDGGTPWEHPLLENVYTTFNQTDLMDDTQKGTSLKSIEGHLGMSIEESSVPFDIDRPLTDEEKDEVTKYCIHDVDATEKLLEIRKDYLETKLHLASLADINPYKALKMTDPKLAAAFMRAEPVAFDDEREYEFPKCLDYDLIPDDVKDFFSTIWDKSIPNEELFKTKLSTIIGGCPTDYGWGGVHGAIKNYKVSATEDTLILNFDVSSLYPSLMIEFGYVSRAVPSADVFANVRAERFKAKAAGDKKTANSLKSPLNKSYGAMLNKYNAMYDAKMARSVCISGQLAITELAVAYTKVEGLQIIQLNTDGIAISIPKDKYDEVIAINDWWQKQTNLELEEDKIEFIWQKDVNNYVLRKTDGSEKVKGGYLVRGIAPIGAWSINNNATIVAEAIKQYLLDGKDIAKTINECNDPSKFQIIAKASGKYGKVYQEIFPEPVGKAGVETVACQKCNRVYATKDARYGKLYKVKKADGSVAKIENLPDHCLISNAGYCSIDKIDKSYYIQLAQKRADDFKEVSMVASKPAETDYSKLNVYRKLAIARKMLQDKNIKKSGINAFLEFDYFELEDIIPAETEVFSEVGLLDVFNYVDGGERSVMREDGIIEKVVASPMATLTIFNVDDPSDCIVFTAKWPELNPILNKDNVDTGNPLQRAGSERTYLRRYLKMTALDLVEHDDIDANLKPAKTPAKSATKSSKTTKSETAKSTSTRKKPATAQDRKQATTKAATSEAPATKTQVTQLKKQCRAIKEQYGADHEEVGAFIAELGATTNKFADITKKQAEDALIKLGEMKEQFETETEDE